MTSINTFIKESLDFVESTFTFQTIAFPNSFLGFMSAPGCLRLFFLLNRSYGQHKSDVNRWMLFPDVIVRRHWKRNTEVNDILLSEFQMSKYLSLYTEQNDKL